MSFEIRFTPEAEETYTAVVAQLKERWGERFITLLESKLLKSLKLIASHPELYPVIDEPMQVRRCLLHKNCAMLYKVYPDAIVIVCFWDNRQDPLIIA